jgi:hypothetical protein
MPSGLLKTRRVAGGFYYALDQEIFGSGSPGLFEAETLSLSIFGPQTSITCG